MSQAGVRSLVDFGRGGVDLSVVEPRIRALVEALNFAGCETVASCEGHAIGARAPYVLLHCDVALADALERRLRGAASGQLRFYWTLHGMFDPRGRLNFRLGSPELEFFASRPLTAVWRLGFGRAEVDSDLRALVELVPELRLSVFRGGGRVFRA